MTQTATPVTAGETPPSPPSEDPFAPLPSRTISDVETLKALSDPIRLRILEVMVEPTHGEQIPRSDWTVKAIAKALGTGPTKLYHHIRILEDAELIRPSGQQLVRGIVETRYRIAQLELRLDRRLFAAGAPGFMETANAALLTVFDVARADHLKAVELGLGDHPTDPTAPSLIALTRTHVRTTRARALELKERLAALFDEFDADDDSADVTLSVFFSLHPIVDPKIHGATARSEAR